MTLLIDNYDSFSYNLYQMIGALDGDIRAVRNDAVTVAEIAALNPARIVLSPGPGRPEGAGVCMDTVRALGGKIPILGVCLGHQAICAAYGGRVSYAGRLMHGKQSDVSLSQECPLFAGLPAVIPAARYHSLAAAELPDCLTVTARAGDGEIMAVRHRAHPVYGVQFHPESILTPSGVEILKNFISLSRERRNPA